MKKSLCIILMLCLCLAMPVLAETSDKDTFSKVEQRVIEDYNGNNVHVSLNETVSLPVSYDVSFEISNWSWDDYSGETGMIKLYVYVVFKNEDDEDEIEINISDFDFALISEADYSVSGYKFYWPEAAYILTGVYSQEVVYPITVHPGDVNAVLEYKIPADTEEASFVYTNMWSDGSNNIEAEGSIYTYDLVRTKEDFIFTNSTDLTITELYFAAENDKSWGNNLLLEYTDHKMDSGDTILYCYSADAVENKDGVSWEVKVVFENGKSITFSGIKLDEAITLELKPNAEKEGHYIMRSQF